MTEGNHVSVAQNKGRKGMRSQPGIPEGQGIPSD